MQANANVGDCFMRTDLNHWALLGDLAVPVPCDGKHTAQTVAVQDVSSLDLSMSFEQAQELKEELAGYTERKETVPADRQQLYADWRTSAKPVFTACRAQMLDAIDERDPGVGHAERTTIFDIDVTGPTQAQWDAGDRTARCDIVRKLDPDAMHKVARLLSLPTSLAQEGASKANQYCWSVEDGKTKRELCTSKAFKDGAWLTIYADLPLPSVSKPKSQKAAEQALVSECRKWTRSYVAPDHLPLASKYVDAWAWDSATGDSVSALKAWDSATATLSCAIPNWAYRGPANAGSLGAQ